MFGFGSNSRAVQPDPEQLKALRDAFLHELHSMDDASPSTCERVHARLKDRVRQSKLPMEWKTKILNRAKVLECQANMRACDKALHRAMHSAMLDEGAERRDAMKEASSFLSKASGLGADQDWRKAAQRMIETVMLSGGVHRKGPTPAKPDWHTPTNPRSAKL